MGVTLKQHLFDTGSALVLHGNTSLADGDLRQLLDFDSEQRRNIKVVVLSHTNVTGESMKHLAALPNLQALYLGGTRVADDAPLEMLPKTVELVNLDGTATSDLSIAKLSRLPRLRSLSLRKTQITDGSVHQLVKVSTLREVCLAETAVSEQARQRLENSLVLDVIRFAVALRYIQFSVSIVLRSLSLRLRPDPGRYL